MPRGSRHVHLVLSAADSRDALKRELAEATSGAVELEPGLFSCGFEMAGVRAPRLAFARQLLPDAREVTAQSVRAFANQLVESVAGVLPDHRTWSLHVVPFRKITESSRMGARAWHSRARMGLATPKPAEAAVGVGEKRCHLIREAVVESLLKRRRHLVRYLRQHAGAFMEDEALVQLLLVSNTRGFLSVATAPLPFHERHSLSCFPGGEVTPAVDKQAPSRAFQKLVESELRLGRRILARESCVDLGASPGSWTYVAARRGASVTAVDRADLRADLMQHPNVHFERGDAFRFEPPDPVDWLLCDVIAEAERAAERLLYWLRRRWCRHFVVTLKLDRTGSAGAVAVLKRELPELTDEFWLTRLSANKNEVCAFGTSRSAQFGSEIERDLNSV